MPDLATALPQLTALGRALTGAIQTETIAGHAADALERLFPAAAASVVLEPEPGAAYEVAATRGTPRVALGQPFLEACLVSAHLVRTERPPCLGAPLVAAGHTFGALVVEAEPPAVFTAEDDLVLSAAAAEVSLAVQNYRLLTLLSAGKREWEQMVDAIGAAVCIVDHHGTVHRANRTFAELVGTPVTALAGRAWQELLPPGWLDPVSRLLASPGGTPPSELRDRGRVFVATAIAIGGEDPLARATVLLLDDHTERRRLQGQLIQSEKMSAVGQLISGVAHELNNPLASVLGFADFLIESGEVPPALADPLRVIQQEAQRAAGIVKNLLTFARRQDQERRPVAIGEVLERTTALLRNQLIQSRVDAVLEVADDLPDVFGSPNQLQQVFVNLINNGAQAIATTGKPGTITIRARPWLDGVAVDVEDTGPGVPPELAERIFEPFFTTKREGEGTGLGLSICQGLVKEHGGRLSLRSPVDGGATFTVELPPASAPAAAGDGPAAPLPSRARVLVVDDESHILHYMRATLEAWGHEVQTARDGAEGLRLALEGNHDLVFTDVRMPGAGGREFYETLRERAPAVAARVVFATGDTVADDTLAFLAATGRPVLTKPFKLAELRATLAAALASH
jgi:signal transduction histidine kinase/CheY-like chemotaxis protein